jgi:glycosyltransferase involved in cell wall biosynthesis
MKIVYTATAQIPSERANSIQVLNVSQAMAALGNSVTLVVPDMPPASAEERRWEALARRHGLQTRFDIEWLALSPIWKRRGFAWQAVRRARRLGADLLYARTLPCAVLGLLSGLPVILEMHKLPSDGFELPWYRLFLGLPGRKRLVPITHAMRRILGERYGLPAEDQIRVAPDGVDTARYAALPEADAARAQLDLAPGLTAMCTGQLYGGRGTDLFLALAERFPQVQFAWVGGRAEEVEKWRQKGSEAGLQNLAFTGQVSNERIPLYQAAADILLMPYERSIRISGGGNTADFCSPLKMFEYMAAGRAIISSDLPVLHEVLNDGNAIFCPPDELEAWSNALGRLVSDGSLRQALGQRARQDVEQYSWQRRAAMTLEGFDA